jgi:hypothetical protein
MRFIVVCDQGHLQDVDWYWWAHRNRQASDSGQCARQTSVLKFNTTGASGGDFNAMSIECHCGAHSTFEGLTDRPYPLRCGGKQPWQRPDEATACSGDARVHPRGASNVYYPLSLSALDIGAEGLVQQVGKEAGLKVWLEDYQSAKAAREAVRMLGEQALSMPALWGHLVDEGCRQFELSRDAVEAIVLAFLANDPGRMEAATTEVVGHDGASQYGFFVSEWPFLSRSVGIQTEHLRTRPVSLRQVWPRELSNIFDQVTLIDRLREVRALVGFRRLKPDSKIVPVDIGHDLPWLPGVDLFGEGIFLRLNEALVSAWEQKTTSRLSARLESLQAKCERWGREPSTQYATPRFIALHTISHGLIRRLAFDAGYSSSSLRERVYSKVGSSPMAGVLIYTSDGDSEGSLGGLVRQGEPDRLLSTVRRALIDLQWCSADPVCSELEHQGVDGLNAAACHACALVSETSCMFNNSLLDRRLLFGSQKDGIEGLFADLTGSDFL